MNIGRLPFIQQSTSRVNHFLTSHRNRHFPISFCRSCDVSSVKLSSTCDLCFQLQNHYLPVQPWLQWRWQSLHRYFCFSSTSKFFQNMAHMPSLQETQLQDDHKFKKLQLLEDYFKGFAFSAYESSAIDFSTVFHLGTSFSNSNNNNINSLNMSFHGILNCDWPCFSTLNNMIKTNIMN